MNPWNGYPRVTQCVIYLSEKKLLIVSNAFLEQTSISKYYIGIDQETNEFKEGANNIDLTYPFLKIDKRGSIDLKCPTIDGGKWMEKIEFPLCHNQDLVINGQKLNIIASYAQFLFSVTSTTLINFFCKIVFR